MGVLARQSFKYSIIGYFGFLLGTFSAVFVFPFDPEFYGKLRYILPNAAMYAPLVVFGLSFSNVRFFGDAAKFGKQQNLLSLSVLAVLFNFAIFCGGYFLVNQIFPQWKQSEMWRLKSIILPLVLILSLSTLFNKFISNYKRIVAPNILENLLPKFANLLAFCLFFFLGFSEKVSFGIFISLFIIGLAVYIFYTDRLEKFRFDFSTGFICQNALWKAVLSYSFFGFLGNIGNVAAFNINNVMIGEYLSFEENGVYSNILSIVTLINIPLMGVQNISAPMIRKHFEDGTMSELNLFHKSTSLSLFFPAAALFSCLLVGFPHLAELMPKNGGMLKDGEPLVWILGAGILFDLATGFNSYIISMSKFYKFNIVIMIFLAVLTLILNFYFIKNTSLGILGVAISTTFSLTIYNIVKLIFNYLKFNVFPLGIKMLYTVMLSLSAVFIAWFLPETKHALVNLVYKPTIVLIIIFLGNHFLKIYPLEKYLNKEFFKSLFQFK